MAQDIVASLRRTEKFLDSAIESQDQRLLRSLSRLEKRIVALAARLKTDKEGRIRGPKWTLKQAQEIHKQLAGEFAETFGQAVASNVEGFDEVIDFVRSQFEALDVPVAFSTLDRRIVDVLKAQAFEVYEGIGYEAQNRIAQGVYDAVIGGQSFSSLAKQIAASLVGVEDVRGRPLSQYASVYAQDSLMEFYSTIHRQKAEDAGLDHFLYYGDIIKATRSFCRARAGKVYSREEIEGWEKLGPWAGRKPGSIWIVRGGYNCRHHFHAVDPDWLPEGEIEVQVFRKGEAVDQGRPGDEPPT